MVELSVEQLQEIIQYPQLSASLIRKRCEKWVQPLQDAMAEFQIDTPMRAAHFIAQLAHECGGFAYTHELWGPTPAQAKYDTRADLGNTRPEAIAIASMHKSKPGIWWRGHGPIQITGYDNHKECGEALGLDLLNHPELLELPVNGCRAAAWYWQTHGLNELADTGNVDHVSDEINRGRITQRVGDANGYPERKRLTERALQALDVAA